jgi:hypothetical protein
MNLDFLEKARLLRIHPGSHHFHRHPPLEIAIGYQVHLAHAAFTEAAENPVALGSVAGIGPPGLVIESAQTDSGADVPGRAELDQHALGAEIRSSGVRRLQLGRVAAVVDVLGVRPGGARRGRLRRRVLAGRHFDHSLFVVGIVVRQAALRCHAILRQTHRERLLSTVPTRQAALGRYPFGPVTTIGGSADRPSSHPEREPSCVQWRSFR